MFQLRLNVNGTQRVLWPRKDAGVARLGRDFLAAQQQRAEAERFPRLDLIEGPVQVTEDAIIVAEQAEADRMTASGKEKEALGRVKGLLRTIIAGLTYRYLGELEVLGQWGIPVVGIGESARTRAPRKKQDVLDTVTRYIAREELLPEEERLATPALSEVTAVWEELVAVMEQRRDALIQREKSIAQRAAEARVLLQWLQLAAAYHIMVDYGGVVDARLQDLGFEVAAI